MARRGPMATRCRLRAVRFRRRRRSRRCRDVPYAFTDTASLRTAAQEYNANAANATVTYGPISSWGVSAITSTHQLFYNLGEFNADVSAWNTSGVTDMSDMFRGASAFNQPLSLDTSSVTDMS